MYTETHIALSNYLVFHSKVQIITVAFSYLASVKGLLFFIVLTVKYASYNQKVFNHFKMEH